MAARLFAPLAQRIGFPAVLGELLLGVLLGNLGLLGVQYFDGIPADPIIAFVAELGVIVLLLQIGLETRLQDLMAVGDAGHCGRRRRHRAALPARRLSGRAAAAARAPDHNTYLFLGATLAATSVGITGRVFRDLGRLDSAEARIVLGAAVIDDVLGLVILAVVSSLVQLGSVDALAKWRGSSARPCCFSAAASGIGRAIAPHSSRWLARLDAGHSMLFAQVLATGLALAWLAHAMGLAPIIGAFAAGLLFEPVFLNDFERPRIVRDDRGAAAG